MYRELKALLESGHQVTFRPMAKDRVQLTVEEAKNGLVAAVQVEMGIMEWGLSEQGIADRLKEASKLLPS